MEQLRRKTSAKIIGIFFFALLMTYGVIAGGAMLALYAGTNMYNETYEAYEDEVMKSAIYEMTCDMWNCHVIWEDYGKRESLKLVDDIKDGTVYPELRFKIQWNDKTITSTLKNNEKYIEKYATKHFADAGEYSITTYVIDDQMKGTRVYRVKKFAETTYEKKWNLIISSGIALIFAIGVLIFLCYGAGRREEDNAVHLRWIDRRFGDIYTILAGGCIVGLLAGTFQVISNELFLGLFLAWIAGYLICLIGMSWLMSMAVQVKNHTLVRNSLLGYIFRLIARAVRCIPFLWKGMSILGIILLANIIASGSYACLGFFLAEGAILMVIGGYVLWNLRKLKIAGEKIASGEVEHRVNTSRMTGSIKEHGENLNSISEGVAKAVEEKMKSERFKAELITNVSHDIKTPLTSIINYAELLREYDDNRGGDDTSREYINIIHANSLKLKKLTSDIVEASKASTGSINVNLVRIDLGMLVQQGLGEYEEKLEKAGLQVISSIEEDIYMDGDGRHMWRIIDNILSNILKYAQKDTRVYVEVKKEEGKAAAVFKNVSRYELNISSAELMERFVRGDTSRNTEGSGLGLSIASDLTQLQHGNMDIEIDGDLFKVRLSFDESAK